LLLQIIIVHYYCVFYYELSLRIINLFITRIELPQVLHVIIYVAYESTVRRCWLKASIIKSVIKM